MIRTLVSEFSIVSQSQVSQGQSAENHTVITVQKILEISYKDILVHKDIVGAVSQMLPNNSGGNQKSYTYPNTESMNFSVHHNNIDSFCSKLDLCTILQFH